MRQLNTGYHFDRLAWGTAIGSVGGIGLFLWFVASYTTTLYQNLYADRTASAIASRQVGAAQEDITDYFRGPPVLGLLKRQNDPVTKAGEEAAIELARISATLSKDSLQPAAAHVESIKKNLSAMENFPSAAANDLAPLSERLDRAAKRSAELRTAQARKSTLTSQQSSALTQFNLIAKDAADFFSLGATHAVGNESAPSVYSTGILANIPKLPGLPDGIPSLDVLQKYLSAAGGSVKLSGTNAPGMFSQKISNLQSGGAAVTATLNQLEAQISDLNRATTQLSDQVQSDAEDVTTQFRDSLRSFMLQLKR